MFIEKITTIENEWLNSIIIEIKNIEVPLKKETLSLSNELEKIKCNKMIQSRNVNIYDLNSIEYFMWYMLIANNNVPNRTDLKLEFVFIKIENMTRERTPRIAEKYLEISKL